MPAGLPFQEAIDRNGRYLIYAHASCDWKSSMPKHSLDARRNQRRTTADGQSGRPASRFKTIWGALNGTFVATIIGVAGAMGAAIIPTYLDSSHGSTSASSSPSPNTGPRPFGDFPRRAGPLPHYAAPAAGSVANGGHSPCPPGTILQHFAARQGSPSQQGPTGQKGSSQQSGSACRPCPVRRPSATYGPRLTSQSRPPST